MTAATKLPAGRPRLPDERRLVVVPIRLTAAQRLTLRRIGVKALRFWLDRQTPTQP